MARPLRIEFAGAYYHVTARGNARADIYLNDQDRLAFLQLLGKVCAQYDWCCHAYCLMTNHYHLVIETGDASLSKGMRQLNGIYTQSFNRTHRRVGHVFQGRFQAILVDHNAYLLEVIRYVLLNPVRAGMTRTVGQYPWGSYRAMIGKAEVPAWLALDRVLTHFGDCQQLARRKFVEFIRDGKKQPRLWEKLRNQIYLGEEQFVEQMQQYVRQDHKLDEIPRLQRREIVKPLEFYAQQYPAKEAMRHAWASGAYTLKAIAGYFGVHYSTVSRAVHD